MINELMARLLDELRAGEVPDPLTASFTFAALWDDLARLAGETPPVAVRQLYEANRPPTDPSGWGERLTAISLASPPVPPL